MTINEKSAYLKGLMDGLKLSTETDEGKMIAAIVDLLGDITKKVTDLNSADKAEMVLCGSQVVPDYWEIKEK